MVDERQCLMLLSSQTIGEEGSLDYRHLFLVRSYRLGALSVLAREQGTFTHVASSISELVCSTEKLLAES